MKRMLSIGSCYAFQLKSTGASDWVLQFCTSYYCSLLNTNSYPIRKEHPISNEKSSNPQHAPIGTKFVHFSPPTLSLNVTLFMTRLFRSVCVDVSVDVCVCVCVCVCVFVCRWVGVRADQEDFI